MDGQKDSGGASEGPWVLYPVFGSHDVRTRYEVTETPVEATVTVADGHDTRLLVFDEHAPEQLVVPFGRDVEQRISDRVPCDAVVVERARNTDPEPSQTVSLRFGYRRRERTVVRDSPRVSPGRRRHVLRPNVAAGRASVCPDRGPRSYSGPYR